MKGREVLRSIDRLAQGILHPISYNVCHYNKFLNLPVEDGLNKSKKAYEDSLKIPEYCESDYWGKRLEIGFRKAIYATFVGMQTQEEKEFESIPLEKIANSCIMDAAAYLTKWADNILEKKVLTDTNS
ncbi:MAG: hypothetical protein Q7S56_00565 [Nanoarchaeota archaeon]|nr:hypothetical protein [Nanoarchaeota archaeon]